MNSRKRTAVDAADLTIKRILKNWAFDHHPPADSRERLLHTASLLSNPPPIKLTILSLISIPSNFSELSFERFAQSRAHTLRTGMAIL
jgi:hypothetical protein